MFIHTVHPASVPLGRLTFAALAHMQPHRRLQGRIVLQIDVHNSGQQLLFVDVLRLIDHQQVLRILVEEWRARRSSIHGHIWHLQHLFVTIFLS